MRLFSVDEPRKPWTKWVLTIATVIVAALAALLLMVACVGCASARGPWKATYRLEVMPQNYKGNVIKGKVYETNASGD